MIVNDFAAIARGMQRGKAARGVEPETQPPRRTLAGATIMHDGRIHDRWTNKPLIWTNPKTGQVWEAHNADGDYVDWRKRT